LDAGGFFYLYSPYLPAPFDDQIDFHLIFIAVVGEAQLPVMPVGLTDQLLYGEALQ
jgi:hypothetical protein